MTIEPLPKQSSADVGLVVAKTALSFIPVVGGATTLAELMSTPLQRRRDKWLTALAETVNELALRKALTVEDLLADEGFVTAAVHASQIAIRSHQKEKLTALRNAVSNSLASTHPLDDDERSMFLDLIDSLTPTHVKVLKWLAENSSMDPPKIVSTTFPEFQGRGALCHRIVSDLEDRGLFIPGKTGDLFDPADTNTRGSYALVSSISEFGKAFLRFIDDPAN